jgi:hypothetical protein
VRLQRLLLLEFEVHLRRGLDLYGEMMMQRLFFSFLGAAVLMPVSALAGPATLLIVLRSDTNPVTTISFASLTDCDATADHLMMVRSENKSALGVSGAWKRNFKDTASFREEPRIAAICIPSPTDISAVKAVLTEKGWYRDIFK